MNVNLKTYRLVFLLFICCAFPACSTMGQNSNVGNLLRKRNLKILHIGNSYTFDAVSYLPQIIEGTGSDVSDMCIYRTMRSGGTFKNWYDIYYNLDTFLSYQIVKVCGGIDANIETGDGGVGNGALFRKALTDEQWDIIFIQNASTYAPYYDLWTGHDLGGYLDELLDIIKKHQPQATIGLMLVHSYASDFSANTEHSSLERWKLIASSVNRCCNDYGIDLVVPYGTAVQNLRASSFNNAMDLTADSIHCGYVLTRYVASCCYYETIIAPRSGVSVVNDRTRIDRNWFGIPTTYLISVDDVTAPIAQRAAVLAVKDPNNCHDPETYKEEPTPEPGSKTLTWKKWSPDEKCYALPMHKEYQVAVQGNVKMVISNGKKTMTTRR